MALVIEWYSQDGRLLQVVDTGKDDTAQNRRSMAADAKRQITVNRGMSDAPSGAHHFKVEAI